MSTTKKKEFFLSVNPCFSWIISSKADLSLGLCRGSFHKAATITFLYLFTENDLICDCKLAWIWGLRNETKNTKLRDALEELTCFLESNNATQKFNNEGLGKNQPSEVASKFRFMHMYINIF